MESLVLLVVAVGFVAFFSRKALVQKRARIAVRTQHPASRRQRSNLF
ncbi:hypothetical protein [Vogesella mureinivorans]|nr:hypothetical protein [Vogesella mureinivorans]